MGQKAKKRKGEVWVYRYDDNWLELSVRKEDIVISTEEGIQLCYCDWIKVTGIDLEFKEPTKIQITAEEVK